MAYRQIENSDIGMFQIVESFLKGKHAETDNEDAIFINPAFAASDFRKNGKTTGQWAVQCVMEALQGLSVEATCLEAVSAITARIRNFYTIHQLTELVEEHPEFRCTASAVIYSAFRREIWQIGDCRCLTHDFYSANEKEVDRVMAEARVACNEAALASGMTIDELAALVAEPDT